MSLADDDISRWVDEVEEATRGRQFLSIAMPPMPEKRIQPPRRVKKRPRNDPSIEEMAESEPPPKKRLASASKVASRASSITANSLLLLESAGITLETLDPARLPEDSHPLYFSISQVSKRSSNFIPTAARSHISTTLDPIEDSQVLRDYHLKDEAAMDELQLLRHVLGEAHRCSRERVHEADWNCTVQSPILAIALKSLPYAVEVRPWNITGADIVPDYLPRTLDTDEPLPSHKIDFCLAVEASTSVKSFVLRQTLPMINQTDYPPLIARLIAVSIETKAESHRATRLATWTYAWLSRITQLVPADSAVPTLPLLRVIGHEWLVSWAWKTGDNPLAMTLTSELGFGNTRDILGMYKILAVLRHLAKWVDEVFQPWAIKTFQ